MRTHTRETQETLTPDTALRILQEGNERFVKNLKADRNLLHQVNETATGQFPFAAILSCMDSRTSAELIFDQGLGDVFSIRVAGNIVNQDILGSLEYACKVAGSKLVLVMGHTKCGAIAGAVNQVELGNLTSLLNKIKPAVDHVNASSNGSNGSIEEKVQHVTEKNVHLVIDQIKQESPVLAEMEEKGEIKIIGALYDVESGKVQFYI